MNKTGMFCLGLVVGLVSLATFLAVMHPVPFEEQLQYEKQKEAKIRARFTDAPQCEFLRYYSGQSVPEGYPSGCVVRFAVDGGTHEGAE